jgi:hypothetical protein
LCNTKGVVLTSFFEKVTPNMPMEARTQTMHILNYQGLSSMGMKHPPTLEMAATVAIRDNATEAAKEIES